MHEDHNISELACYKRALHYRYNLTKIHYHLILICIENFDEPLLKMMIESNIINRYNASWISHRCVDADFFDGFVLICENFDVDLIQRNRKQKSLEGGYVLNFALSRCDVDLLHYLVLKDILKDVTEVYGSIPFSLQKNIGVAFKNILRKSGDFMSYRICLYFVRFLSERDLVELKDSLFEYISANYGEIMMLKDM